ncbi:hypothetical protein BG261_07900 [Floricoccus tropicus]|uniref:Uncharacterized protein n=1 Tax=Floricoccus tropicus TaxID=1859473 RepID=A0A1E8GJS2_9LACT|nr:hypothetical protein [Floricoccus tropicus]OFI48196.1 hypothetical protein BG261_07900 [Floricoccus tropicus]
MKENIMDLFNNRIVLIIIGFGILYLQKYFGKKDYKILGAILPLIFLIISILFILNGQIKTLWDVFMIFLSIFMALGSWLVGYESGKEKQAKELEKMKAKDYINK